MTIPTYEGSGQCVHPDVVLNDGWVERARYVMVMEPYPYGDDRFENPSIVCSGDGLTWEVPAGTVNPIVAAPTKGGWNSDGELAVTPDGVLSLYYRWNSGRGETTLLRTLYRGAGIWSAPEVLFTRLVSGHFASPAIVSPEGGMQMFYVDTLQGTVNLMTSSDGLRWSNDRVVLRFPGVWHLDAFQSAGSCWLLLTDLRSLYLFRSADLTTWNLYSDHHGWTSDHTVWCEPDRRRQWRLIAPVADGWDDGRIYRASGLLDNQELKIWYGAQSLDNEWRIGHTSGELSF